MNDYLAIDSGRYLIDIYIAIVDIFLCAIIAGWLDALQRVEMVLD